VPHAAELTEDLGVNLVLWNRMKLCVADDLVYHRPVGLILEEIVLQEQRRLPHLLHRDSHDWIDDEDPADEVLSLGTQVLRHLVLCPPGLRQHQISVWFIERKPAIQHGEEDDAHTPDIDRGAFVGLIIENLGGGIVRTAACSRQLMVWRLVQCGHAEVSNFDLSILREKDILGLEIAVANIEVMTVLQRAHYLAEKINRHGFLKEAMIVDKREQVPFVDEFSHDVAVAM